MEDLFTFNSDIMNFVWKTDEGEAESIVLLIFCFLGVLQSWMGEGLWDETESLI